MSNNASKKIVLSILVPMILVTISLVSPDVAFAATGNAVGFSSVIESLKFIISAVALPIAVLLAAWKIIYLSVFCGMAGIDPLNMMNGTDAPKNSDVWKEVKNHFKGFAYGLAWVGGVWIIFQFALSLVGILVTAFTKVF